MTLSTHASAPEWADDSVQVDARQVRYRSTGNGDALVVVTASAATVSPALELLVAQRRVVVAELITDPAEPARELGARIAAFAGALDLSSVAVLGAGPAATAALWTAVDNPGLVSTLVLEAPTVFGSDVAADAQLVDAMTQCEVPTLVLLGQRDPVASPRFAGDYKRLPASSVAIVYAAGADISNERPEAFASTVNDYLQRGQAFVLSTASTLIHA